VDLGLQVLAHLAVLTPALRRLLGRHPDDFLYGCCAADIIVGKNFARHKVHCHNWQVGLRVLAAARDDAQRSLCYGFLAHLAADTVAHNYAVPYKAVESFHAPMARHLYWELRFDQAAHANEAVWPALRRIGRRPLRAHDEFLGETLAASSRLFSFSVSRRLFDSMLMVSRLRRWRLAAAALARRSRLPLAADEWAEGRRLALDAALAFLIDGERSRVVASDPIGARSLGLAKELRRELRALRRRRRIDPDRWPAALRLLRRRFRDSIHGKLEIPDLAAVLAPR
jgi:hypothetical protein